MGKDWESNLVSDATIEATKGRTLVVITPKGTHTYTYDLLKQTAKDKGRYLGPRTESAIVRLMRQLIISAENDHPIKLEGRGVTEINSGRSR